MDLSAAAGGGNRRASILLLRGEMATGEGVTALNWPSSRIYSLVKENVPAE